MKKQLLGLILIHFAILINSQWSLAFEKPKAMIIISSAKELPLQTPSAVGSISTGFFLIELARLLEVYEDQFDFVFVTPDGEPPQLDINGMDLNIHIQGPSAPLWSGASGLKQTLLPYPDFLPSPWNNLRHENFLALRKDEISRRLKEINLAKKHLGKIPISKTLPNTHPEVKKFSTEVAAFFEHEAQKDFFSLKEILEKDSDPSDPFKISKMGFIFMPGGHAPMVDFVQNPYLGDVLRRAHQKVLIAAICHGPIAFESTQYSLLHYEKSGKLVVRSDNPFRGLRITTVSEFEETLMLRLGYPKVPFAKNIFKKDSPQFTRLEYFVDQELFRSGYLIEYGNPLKMGVQLYPGYPHVVFDRGHKVLTGNGPQTMDQFVDEMRKIIPTQ